jgi:hypothetical protein
MEAMQTQTQAVLRGFHDDLRAYRVGAGPGHGPRCASGQRRFAETIGSGGFRRVSRAAETPFNMVLEARA